MNDKNVPTISECACKAIVWTDKNYQEITIEYCPLHANAEKMRDALEQIIAVPPSSSWKASEMYKIAHNALKEIE